MGCVAACHQDISKIKSSVGNADWRNGNITAHLAMIVETYRDYARNLLDGQPALTIEDIADRCGFEHTPNFYSAFKKMYGITPMDYRKGISI